MVLEPVKIAVIGSSGYAFQLIKRILSVPNCGTVVAVASRDLDSCGAEYCRSRKIPVFQTVEELLDFGEFEVVVNPTPIHLHTPITKQCLAAGFPVWLEKPPVATVQELDELCSVSEEAGISVAVCFNSLFSHLTQNLKKQLVAGRFGNVRQIKGIGAWIRNSEYFSRNNWAGSLKIGEQWVLDGDVNNPFAHVLCNNLFFAGSEQHALAEPIKVEAELYRCNEIESEDTSCLRIMTAEGIEIIDYLTLGPRCEIPPKTVIETEKALISFENFNLLKIEFYNGVVEEHEAYQEDRIEMIEHLCRAFRTREPYICSLDTVRPFTLAVNGAFDSSRHIHPIPPEYLQLERHNNTTSVSISGVETTMWEAFASNSLYSEIGVPWARKGQIMDMSDYLQFPTRFEAKVILVASK